MQRLSELKQIRTMNDDGINEAQEVGSKPGLTIIIGGRNFIHAKNAVQLNTENLPETIESVTQGLKDVPPEVVDKIAEPLGRLLDAIADLITKSQV